MKVSVQKIVSEVVDIPNSTVLLIVQSKLKEMLGTGDYLHDMNGTMVVTEDDPEWRHGSVQENYIRDATELDIALFTVLKALK